MKSVFHFLASTIDVTIHPQSIQCHCKDTRLELIPCLYVSGDDGRILEIGRDISVTSPEMYRVDLFRATSEYPHHLLPKMGCIAAFFQQVFRSLFSRRGFIRPKVRVRGAETVGEFLAGYQESLLSLAILQAGACEVQFLSPDGRSYATYTFQKGSGAEGRLDVK